jgi:hypothetical protein
VANAHPAEQGTKAPAPKIPGTMILVLTRARTNCDLFGGRGGGYMVNGLKCDFHFKFSFRWRIEVGWFLGSRE